MGFAQHSIYVMRVYLFLNCMKTEKIWNCFGDVVGVNFSRFTDLGERTKEQALVNLTRMGLIYWEGYYQVILWGLGLERNRRCFNGIEKNMAQIICDIKD